MKKKRIFVFGGTGFIGQEIINKIPKKKYNIFSFGKKKFNLLKKNKKQFKNDDRVIFISALAPCKNIEILIKNIKMINNFLNILQKSKIAHFTYISSDAVYKDSYNRITESSCAEPSSLHGLMHLSREIIIKNFFKKTPYAIIRPTLIYGLKDPHNGYGPNKFIRSCKSNTDLKIFGNGEEIRDHVHVEDVANLVSKISISKKTGIYNAVSANEVSFSKISNFIRKKFKSNIKIIKIKRIGKMPHNGIRIFNNKKIKEMFPKIKFNPWEIGITKIIQQYEKK